MYDKVKTINLLLPLIASLVTFTVTAGERPAGISRQIVNISTLDNISGHSLTAVMVELDPGVIAPSHTHSGFVFVYVLQGTVRSQLNHGDAIEFSTDQSWTEPPGTTHSLTHNPSTTDKAKFLAVFVAKDGSNLTNFGVDH